MEELSRLGSMLGKQFAAFAVPTVLSTLGSQCDLCEVRKKIERRA